VRIKYLLKIDSSHVLSWWQFCKRHCYKENLLINLRWCNYWVELKAKSQVDCCALHFIEVIFWSYIYCDIKRLDDWNIQPSTARIVVKSSTLENDLVMSFYDIFIDAFHKNLCLDIHKPGLVYKIWMKRSTFWLGHQKDLSCHK